MKKHFLIPAAVILILILAAAIFWEPLIDFLPIDQSGWSTNEHGSCYLDEDGDPVSGWYTVEATEYYFHPNTQALHTGWIDRGGVRCYVKEGLPVSGWTETPEGRFYLKEDGSIHTGWLEENGTRLYLDEAGFPASGWTETDEGRFWLNNGIVCTGLVETDTGTYCLDAEGKPHSGWYEQDGKRYYAQENGALHLGWLELDENRYYLREDGSTAMGKLVIDGEPYFFNSTGASFVLVNPWHELPKDFSVNLEIVEGAYVDPVCKEDLVQMLSDCRALGMYVFVLSGYRSVWDQTINFQTAVRQKMYSGYSESAATEAVRQIIAVPGTSEHHLGLAFDIVDSRYQKLDYYQERMAGQQWLMEHSWEYGFILRYPNGTTDITGIIYEPWHYRYVGREMAAEIHELDITLEEYVDMLTNDGTTCGGKTKSE